MSLPLYIHGSTDVGRQRAQNEDAYRIAAQPDGSRLLIVCDGMGGHEAGEVASQVASDRIVEMIAASSPDNAPRAIYQAFLEANQAVLDASVTRGAEGMGTTGVVAWVNGSHCYVGWVGDSRLYHFRAGAAIDRTRDHTRVAQMVSHGILKPEEARNHPDAHVLVQALGGSPGVQKSFKPEVWTDPLELLSGDVVLLCSDGLYDFIEDPELYPLIEGLDYQDAVTRLIQTANERGGADNITVILLVAGQPEVPRTAKGDSQARRETLPEGMPLLSLVPVPPEQAAPEAPSAPVGRAPPAPEPRMKDAPVPSSERTGRHVPLWWLFATGILGLGLGLLLGQRAASHATSPADAPAPSPARRSSLVQTPMPPTTGGQLLPGPQGNPGQWDAGVMQSGPPTGMETPHTPAPVRSGGSRVSGTGER